MHFCIIIFFYFSKSNLTLLFMKKPGERSKSWHYPKVGIIEVQLKWSIAKRENDLKWHLFKVLLTNRQYSPFWLTKGSTCFLHHPAQICHIHKKNGYKLYVKVLNLLLFPTESEYSPQNINSMHFKMWMNFFVQIFQLLNLGVANICKRTKCLDSSCLKCPHVHTCSIVSCWN